MRKLSINIKCGEKTCAEAVGSFCHFLRSRMDGFDPTCALFNKCLRDENRNITGWLQRLPECLDAEKEKKDPIIRRRTPGIDFWQNRILVHLPAKIKTLRENTGLTTSRLILYLRDLEARGIVKREKGGEWSWLREAQSY